MRRASAAWAVAVLIAVAATPSFGGELEVLHWWVGGGEANAAQFLKGTLQARGHKWKDFAVAGSGDATMAVLKSRVQAGSGPAVAQMKGPALQDWARQGALAGIDDVAKAEKWDALLPKVVADTMKYRGSYVAVPVDVHRVNGLWVNAQVLRRAGAKLPTTWDEFFATAEALKKAGVVAVAHGGQSWQDFTTFEAVALGVGGVEFYRKALVKLDRATLLGPTMEKVLRTFKRIKPYTDGNSPGRDWNLSTAMVIRGEAGMQITGDWAKGEFIDAGKLPGRDFLCAPVPGGSKAFSFNIDSFAMFKLKKDADIQAQKDFAAAVMAPDFQELFSRSNGSIPVRLGVRMDRFDDCARQSARDFAAAAAADALVPSIAHGMAVPAAAENAIKEAVSQFWNNDAMSARQAMEKIAGAAAIR
ncbi:MAG TPA: ABC transporter substrate-binding protein [Albitalea sp.]|nr:ABC transporter substrate-binding protein [Albitalea sp.]